MTLPNWKPEDYYIDFESFRYTGNIVDAPIVFKVISVIKYLSEQIFPDAILAIQNGGELSGLLLVFSTIEYLTGYYSGKNSQEKFFVSFMERYFPSQYKNFTQEIFRQLRCGLIHNLTIINPWNSSDIQFILEKYSKLHLQKAENKIVFSTMHFLEDTRRATYMYQYDLIMKQEENKDLINNFNRRFNKKDGAASTMIKTD